MEEEGDGFTSTGVALWQDALARKATFLAHAGIGSASPSPR